MKKSQNKNPAKERLLAKKTAIIASKSEKGAYKYKANTNRGDYYFK